MSLSLAREPLANLEGWAWAAATFGNDPDPKVRAIARLGLVAKEELERRERVAGTRELAGASGRRAGERMRTVSDPARLSSSMGDAR